MTWKLTTTPTDARRAMAARPGLLLHHLHWDSGPDTHRSLVVVHRDDLASDEAVRSAPSSSPASSTSRAVQRATPVDDLVAAKPVVSMSRSGWCARRQRQHRRASCGMTHVARLWRGNVGTNAHCAQANLRH